jgi:hypothetical protein
MVSTIECACAHAPGYKPLICESLELPVATSFDAESCVQANARQLHEFLSECSGDFLKATDGRSPLTYGRLKTFLASGRADVSGFGVGNDDRLAALVGNGPEAAVAFFCFLYAVRLCTSESESPEQ